MADQKPKSVHPVSQALIFLSILAAIYFVVIRPVEYIYDFEIKDQYAFIANGPDGLRVLDTSEPANLHEVGSSKVAKSARAISIIDKYLYLADRARRVLLFDISNPQTPGLISQVNVPGSALDIAIVDQYGFIANDRAGLGVVDFNNLEKPRYLKDKSIKIKGKALHIVEKNKYLYLMDNRRQVLIYRINNQTDLELQTTIEFERDVEDILFIGDLAYFSVGKSGLIVKRIASPIEFQDLGTFKTDGSVQSIGVFGNYGYLAGGESGLRLIDLTDLTNIREVGNFNTTGFASKVLNKERIVYLADGYDGLKVFDTKVMLVSEMRGSSGAPMDMQDVVKLGNLAFIASGDRGLQVLNVENPRQPVLAAFSDTLGYARGVAISGGKALVADGINGLVLIDVTVPAGSLNSIGKAESINALKVASAGENAFVADGEGGLRVINFSQPDNPKVIGVYSHHTLANLPQNIFNKTPFGNDLDLLGDYAYLAAIDQGVGIINIFDPNIPTEVGWLYNSEKGADARAVSVQAVNLVSSQTAGVDPYNPNLKDPNTRIYVYVANGNSGIQIWEVTNYSQPRFVKSIGLPEFNFGELVDIEADRQRLYISSLATGFWVFDITNPEDPKFAGQNPMLDAESRANGIDVDGSIAYLTAQNHGLRVFDASALPNLSEIGFYDAPANIIDLVLSGNYAFAVDGRQGMWVFDVSNPAHPTEINFFRTSGEASGIALNGSFVYVANGSQGLQIINIADPKNLIPAGSIDTGGFAYSVVVSPKGNSIYAYLADGMGGVVVVDVTALETIKITGTLGGIGNAIKIDSWMDYLFVATDQNGLVVVSILDATNPTRVVTYNEISQVTGVEAIDIYAYVCGNNNGLRILDISHPLTISTVKQLYGNLSLVDVTSNLGYAFLSNLNQGLLLLDITNVIDPVVAGSSDAPQDARKTLGIWISPAVNNNKPGFFRLYVADGTRGLKVLESTKSASIDLVGIYATNGTASIGEFKEYISAKLSGRSIRSEKPAITIQKVLFNLLIMGFIGLLGWLAFFALFVLPLPHQKLVGDTRADSGNVAQDWSNLYSRLVLYLFGKHGPMIAVRGGKEVQPAEEKNRNGPGVVVIDASSAVMLEKKLQSKTTNKKMASYDTRVAGSGIIFTGNRTRFEKPAYDEGLRGAVDLRPQFRIAKDVSLSTRDGIEVITSVSTTFTLGQDPDVLLVTYVEGESAQNLRIIELIPVKDVTDASNNKVYKRWLANNIVDELDEADKAEIHQYVQDANQKSLFERQASLSIPRQPVDKLSVDQERISAALYARAQDTRTQESTDWTDLPPYVAAEILRNMVAQVDYDDLYQPKEDDLYPIKDLKSKLRISMRNKGVLSYKFVRRHDGEPIKKDQMMDESDLESLPIQKLNSPQILRMCGIKVLFAGFAELTPTNEDVRRRMFENWRADWAKKADIVLGEHELQAMQIRNKARADSQRNMVHVLSQIFTQYQHNREALALRVYQALERAAAEPATRSLLPEETINMLRSLRYWIMPEEEGRQSGKVFANLPPEQKPPPDNPMMPEDGNHLP